MIPESIQHFSEEEKNAYQRQIDVLGHSLKGAPDVLNNYTCHSIPHIEEVMEQSDMLFDAMWDWLNESAGISWEEKEQARMLLLYAAKFHDIGMMGTHTLQSLLQNTDKQYRLYRIRTGMESMVCLRAEMEKLARRANDEMVKKKGKTSLVGPHFNRILSCSPKDDRMGEFLAAYHEDIKNAIREHHSENSAKWIWEHTEALGQRYGEQIDWKEAAIIAALHSGSMGRYQTCEGDEKNCDEYCSELCKKIGMPVVVNDSNKKRLLALAAILRLADQRRSGNRLRSLERERIEITSSSRERLWVQYEEEGFLKHPDVENSRQIILSEVLNQFGKVSLLRKASMWQMEHEMHFHDLGKKEGRSLLIRMRIPSYVDELDKSLLIAENHICHELLIDLNDEQLQEFEPICLTVNEILSLKDDVSGKSECFQQLEKQLNEKHGLRIQIKP